MVCCVLLVLVRLLLVALWRGESFVFAQDFPPALHPSPIFSLSSVLFSSLSFSSSHCLFELFLSYFSSSLFLAPFLMSQTKKGTEQRFYIATSLPGLFLLHSARVAVLGFYTSSTLFHVCYTVFLHVLYSALRTQASRKQGYCIICAYIKQKSLHTTIFTEKSL